MLEFLAVRIPNAPAMTKDRLAALKAVSKGRLPPVNENAPDDLAMVSYARRFYAPLGPLRPTAPCDMCLRIARPVLEGVDRDNVFGRLGFSVEGLVRFSTWIL